MEPLIMLVDDDAAVCWALEQTLTQAGFRCVTAADARTARRHWQRQCPALVITDVRMPGESGLDLLASVRREYPAVPVIVSTAHATLDHAMAAVGAGAFDYLPKPVDAERLVAAVRRALGETALGAAARPAAEPPHDALIGQASAMQEAFRRLAAAAASDGIVFVHGPSGSGKSLAAETLHRCGRHRDLPLERIAGSAVDAELTVLRRAGPGTIILDELGDVSPLAQARLVTLLEAPLQARLIVLSQGSIESLREHHRVRDDLLHRVAVLTIALPPLTERREDLPALIRHLLQQLAGRLQRPLALSAQALEACLAHSWPGNVRELRHRLEAAALTSVSGTIDIEHLGWTAAPATPQPPALAAAVHAIAQPWLRQHPGEVHARMLELMEAELVRVALAETGGNQLRAAELLGINRITLKKRMDLAGIRKS